MRVGDIEIKKHKFDHYKSPFLEDVNIEEIIWDKVSSDIKTEFDSKSSYNKFFSKTKIKFYGDKATNFHNKEKP